MNISSTPVLVFVCFALLLYWIVPYKYQWIILLSSSVLLYFATAHWYTFIYVIITVSSVFFATRYFQKSNDEKKNKTVLTLCLVLNFGLLAVLKYTNLFLHSVNFIGGLFFHSLPIPDVNWPASLGISYYTLQMTAFLLDCYWGTAKPFNHPLHLGLYCIYFPLSTCGPICRYDQIGASLFKEHRFDYTRVKFGLYQIGWGLIKKLAISNRLASIVNQIWAQKTTSFGINVWISSALFSLQLYTDFSGCIDIVSGISECFGISLPANFNAPFCSKTIQEFWQRWHISLGAWARDYILNPLLKSKTFLNLGNKAKQSLGKKLGRKIPVFVALFFVWLYMGVWHGNSWKYIIGEGLWYWLIIVLSQLLSSSFSRINSALHINNTFFIWRFLRTVRTFLIFMVGALFFRADSLLDAFARIKAGTHISNISESVAQLTSSIDLSPCGGSFGLILAIISLCIVLVVDCFKYNNFNVKKVISESSWYIRWPVYYIILFIIFMSLSIPNQETLYSQF